VIRCELSAFGLFLIRQTAWKCRPIHTCSGRSVEPAGQRLGRRRGQNRRVLPTRRSTLDTSRCAAFWGGSAGRDGSPFELRAAASCGPGGASGRRAVAGRSVDGCSAVKITLWFGGWRIRHASTASSNNDFGWDGSRWSGIRISILKDYPGVWCSRSSSRTRRLVLLSWAGIA
jgi:hypothetical protein